MKGQLSRFLVLLLVCAASPALAEPTTATLDVKEGEVFASNTSSTLRLRSSVRLDSTSNGDCEFALYGFVSPIGDPALQGRRRLLAKVKKKGIRANFRYTGEAVAGELDDQTQLNAQARVKCGSKVIFSNVDSTNVTCDEVGLTPGKFIRELQSKTTAK